MEYEIEDDGMLYDDYSTNPSLKREGRQSARYPSIVPPQNYPADRRRLQMAELFPEEEENQLA